MHRVSTPDVLETTVIDDQAIAEFAAAHASSAIAVQALLDSIRRQVGMLQFYIFWTSKAGGGGASSGGRARTLLAFCTPDAALAFAQRNQLSGPTERPRLRRLTLLQLFHAMLHEPAIRALVIATEGEDQPIAAGQIPPGTRLERADLVRRLRENSETVI